MSVEKKDLILIMDDNEALVESIRSQFICGGFNVTKTTSPVRTLELSTLERPAVGVKK